MQQYVLPVGLAAFLVLAFAGCGKSSSEHAAEKAVESAMAAQGQKADVSIQSDSMKITTQEGSMSFGEGTKIPDDWPSDVPVYKGMKLVTAFSSPEGGALQGTTSDSAAKVESFYKEQAAKNGWTEDASFRQGDMVSLIYKKEKRVLSMIATSADSETSIAISLSNE